ncbi:hypothetical protein PtB15_10B184 [Puccinia triticina]|nr:hypothetical protein PtB15_10B184 [Puccinia triticina]
MASPPKILPQASVSVIPALSSPRVLQLLNGQLDVGQAPQMTNGSLRALDPKAPRSEQSPRPPADV